MCGVEERRREVVREVRMKIVVRQGMISDNLARAGRRVAGGSRWRSMASKTRTKRKFSGRRSCSGG